MAGNRRHVIPSALVAAALLLVTPTAGCGGGASAPTVTSTKTFVFSFVVIADPHVYGTESADRLQACVDWVNEGRVQRGIELVFIAGDLGRSTSARDVLDGFLVPWVPVIGDNVIQGGTEPDFESTFSPHYDALTLVLGNFARQPTPVQNPDVGSFSYLENLSFDHRGVHFLGIDWCTRMVGGTGSETADLHDFPGGTWPWFVSQIQDHAQGRRERIVMISHHPMHSLVGGAGSFSDTEIEAIESVTGLHSDYVFANFAGHYHFNWDEVRYDGGYAVFVTDATWDDENVLRFVRVFDDGSTFSYTTEIVTIEVN